MAASNEAQEIWITAKFNGECVSCHLKVSEGDRVLFDTVTRDIYCEECGEDIKEA